MSQDEIKEHTQHVDELYQAATIMGLLQKSSSAFMHLRIVDYQKALLSQKRRLSAVFCSSLWLSIFWPLLSSVPAIVITGLNPCLEYATVLRVLTLSMYSVVYFLAIVQLWMFNSTIGFCDTAQMFNHVLHSINLFAAVSATLSSINAFVYDGSWWWVLAMSVFVFIAAVEYFITFWMRHHFTNCPHPNSEHEELKENFIFTKSKKGSYFTFFEFATVVFFLIWISLFFLLFGFSYTLYGPERDSYILDQVCLNLTRTQ